MFKKIWQHGNFILAILAALLTMLYIMHLREEIVRIKAHLPHKLIGDGIQYFDLISTDAEEINASVLNGEKDVISGIFIFDNPCSTCSGMIPFWNRISKLAGNYKLKTYGIVPDKIDKAVSLASEGIVNFDLYAPRDVKAFVNRFRMRFNTPQTILYKNGKVIYLKLGQFDAQSYFELANLIKGDKK